MRPEGWLTRAELLAELGLKNAESNWGWLARQPGVRGCVVREEVGRSWTTNRSVYPPETVQLLLSRAPLTVPVATPDLISQAEAARELAISAGTLRRRTAQAGVEMLTRRKPATAAPRPFLRRADLPLLSQGAASPTDAAWITLTTAVHGTGVGSAHVRRWATRRGFEIRPGGRGKATVQRSVAAAWREATGRPPLPDTADLDDLWVRALDATRGTGRTSQDLKAWCERRGIPVQKDGRYVLVPASAALAWADRKPGAVAVPRKPAGWLSLAQAADRLGVTEHTVAALVARRKLKGASVRGIWRLDPEGIAELQRDYRETPPPGMVRVSDWAAVVWFRRRGIIPRQFRNPDCPRNQKANYVSATEWELFESRERRGINPWDYRSDRHRLRKAS